MRSYERMRLPPTLDAHVRNELLKVDKYLQMLDPALARAIGNGNHPGPGTTITIKPGSPPVSSLADHNHSMSGLGGPYLGVHGGTMYANGTWWHQYRVGINKETPEARLHVDGDVPATEYVVPASIPTPGFWTNAVGGATDFNDINDAPSTDDATSVRSAGADNFEAKFAGITAPVPNALVTVKFRARSLGADTDLNAFLYVASTLCATLSTSGSALTGSLQTFSHLITAAEYSAINGVAGNWTDLRFRCSRFAGVNVEVSDIWLEITGLYEGGKTMIVRPASGQTDSLVEFQNSSGTSLITVTPAGVLVIESGGAIKHVPGADLGAFLADSDGAGNMSLTRTHVEEVTFNKSLLLKAIVPSQSTPTPARPASGYAGIFGDGGLGVTWPSIWPESGKLQRLQGSLGQVGLRIIRPGSSTTPQVLGTTLGAAVGTLSHPVPANTNYKTSLRRIQVTNAVGAASVSTVFENNLGPWIGNAAGLGGFYVCMRLCLTASTTLGHYGVFGLRNSTTSFGSATSPSNITNAIVLGAENSNMAVPASGVADTTYIIFHNDNAGTATRVDSGIGLNTPVQFELWCAPNASTVYARVTRLDDETVDQFEATLSSNLPQNTVFLALHAHSCTGVDVTQPTTTTLYSALTESPV